jgi:arylsulfatase A-like enzyme
VKWTAPHNNDVTFTPFLKRFAEEGLRFEHAYTPVPITLPSHASMMTGLLPQRLGVLGNGDRVPETAVTLAERLSEAGYRTGAFISLGVLQPVYGVGQGFDHFYDPFSDGGPARWYRNAGEILPEATSWISETSESEGPFFAWIHLSDPHEPYLPVDAGPDTRLWLDDEVVGEFNLISMEQHRKTITIPPGEHFLRWSSLREPKPDDRPETGIVMELVSRESLAPLAKPDSLPQEPVPLQPDFTLGLRNSTADDVLAEVVFSGWLERPAPSDVLPNYEIEVRYLDQKLAELDDHLESLGVRDNTILAIVSDHGEGLFFHELIGHAAYVYEDQLRVLWMMRGPGMPAGRIVDENPALVADVTPTLLELLGIDLDLDLRVGEGELDGNSWAECLVSGEDCPERTHWWAFGLAHHRRRVTGMAGYQWPFKWIWRRSFPREAYELSADPWELDDLLENAGPHNPEPLKRLAETFRNERRALTELLRTPQTAGDVEEREKLLRSLGYLRGSKP